MIPKTSLHVPMRVRDLAKYEVFGAAGSDYEGGDPIFKTSGKRARAYQILSKEKRSARDLWYRRSTDELKDFARACWVEALSGERCLSTEKTRAARDDALGRAWQSRSLRRFARQLASDDRARGLLEHALDGAVPAVMDRLVAGSLMSPLAFMVPAKIADEGKYNLGRRRWD